MVICINSASGKDHNCIDKVNDGCFNPIDYDQVFKGIGWEVNKILTDNISEKYKGTYSYECLVGEYNRYAEVDNLNGLLELINKIGSIIIYPPGEFVSGIVEEAVGKKIDLELVIYDYYVE